jgi:hypothetical protein
MNHSIPRPTTQYGTTSAARRSAASEAQAHADDLGRRRFVAALAPAAFAALRRGTASRRARLRRAPGRLAAAA